jgi:hypothetical protein
MPQTIIREFVNVEYKLPLGVLEFKLIGEYAPQLADLASDKVTLVHDIKTGVLFNQIELFYLRTQIYFSLSFSLTLEEATASITKQIETAHLNHDIYRQDMLEESEYVTIERQAFGYVKDFTKSVELVFEELSNNAIHFPPKSNKA